MRFRIMAKYYYYAGTYGAPENGYLLGDYKNEKYSFLEFGTREEAEKYLREELNLKYIEDSKIWCEPEGYRCLHGEYSSPDYKIHCFKS